MTRLLAIDPGSTESGWVLYDDDLRMPVQFAKTENDVLRGLLGELAADLLVIEKIESYGMAVGASIFETVLWSGVFLERWRSTRLNCQWRRVPRREVKLHLCGDSRAKDANIRQALIDKWGGKEAAIGRKATPGPLYGISGDVWAALGVAVTAAETEVQR